MSVEAAERSEIDFMGGPRMSGEDWRLVEIREIPWRCRQSMIFVVATPQSYVSLTLAH